MYILKLEQNEVQLIQAVLAGANLNMDQSNLRNSLWTSMQKQLQEQMPVAQPPNPADPPAEG